MIGNPGGFLRIILASTLGFKSGRGLGFGVQDIADKDSGLAWPIGAFIEPLARNPEMNS